MNVLHKMYDQALGEIKDNFLGKETQYFEQYFFHNVTRVHFVSITIV